MRALVYHGPGQRAWQEVPDPEITDSSTPTLMRLAAAGQLDAARLVTHRLGLHELEQAYDVFADAASNGALKVVLTRQEEQEQEQEEEGAGE